MFANPLPLLPPASLSLLHFQGEWGGQEGEKIFLNQSWAKVFFKYHLTGEKKAVWEGMKLLEDSARIGNGICWTKDVENSAVLHFDEVFSRIFRFFFPK